MKQRFKDHYWVKLLKWHLYKRHTKRGRWHTQFAFEQSIRSLKPGDTVLDCGANVGAFTKKLAATGATVHAFEPDPYSFEQLVSNTRGQANVHLYNAAVGIETKPVRLFRSPDFELDPEKHSISSSVFGDKKNVTSKNFVDVEQIDIVAFVQGLPMKVAITKMDIEGAEVAILEEILLRDVVDDFGFVFVETHESRIPSLVERTSQIRRSVAEKNLNRIFLDWD